MSARAIADKLVGAALVLYPFHSELLAQLLGYTEMHLLALAWEDRELFQGPSLALYVSLMALYFAGPWLLGILVFLEKPRVLVFAAAFFTFWLLVVPLIQPVPNSPKGVAFVEHFEKLRLERESSPQANSGHAIPITTRVFPPRWFPWAFSGTVLAYLGLVRPALARQERKQLTPEGDDPGYEHRAHPLDDSREDP